jgi:hypothetical protein
MSLQIIIKKDQNFAETKIIIQNVIMSRGQPIIKYKLSNKSQKN